jgi:hypothetical protein
MKKTMTPVVTGIAAATIAGTAVYMLSNHHSGKHSAAKTLKRNTGKALKTVGTVMENMSYMMK